MQESSSLERLCSLEKLERYSLHARDGDIGRIVGMYFDDAAWVLRYFVVRSGGWLRGREVLLAPRVVTGLDEKRQRIAVDLTRRQVEESPPVDTKMPVSRHYEAEYYRHYGWEPYWMADPLGAPLPVGPRSAPPAEVDSLPEPDDPHLRASTEVRGYGLHARDGDLGEVGDYIVDDRDWKIRYLVVDTNKWLPGRKVLVAPAWVERIDWAQRAIFVDLGRETIRTAPAYDPSQVIGRDYEVQLYGHYGNAVQKAGG